MTTLPKRVLLKVSGEILGGDKGFGLDADEMSRIVGEIKQLVGMGLQVGLVLGGGNLFRGKNLSENGLNQVTGDHIGMLATMMNGLAMRDIIQQNGVSVRLMSAIPILGIAQVFDSKLATQYLQENQVVVMIGGTGNPFFTTDTCACLRAIEIDADLILKATKVDYIYSADPVTHPDAVKYESITYNDVLQKNILIMDHAAICLARDNKKPIRIFNLLKKGNLLRAIKAEVGTVVSS